MKSDTPITDRLIRKYIQKGDRGDDWEYAVPLSDCHALERAANALAEVLSQSRDVAYGKPENHEEFLKRVGVMDKALARFAELKKGQE